jgi:hypothetical protein
MPQRPEQKPQKRTNCGKSVVTKLGHHVLIETGCGTAAAFVF